MRPAARSGFIRAVTAAQASSGTRSRSPGPRTPRNAVRSVLARISSALRSRVPNNSRFRNSDSAWRRTSASARSGSRKRRANPGSTVAASAAAAPAPSTSASASSTACSARPGRAQLVEENDAETGQGHRDRKGAPAQAVVDVGALDDRGDNLGAGSRLKCLHARLDRRDFGLGQRRGCGARRASCVVTMRNFCSRLAADCQPE